MGTSVTVIKLACVVSSLLFVTTCYWSSCLGSEDTHMGALTVTNTDDSMDEDGVVETEEEVLSSEVFIPTHEWQVVKSGQAIPKGLHVRINLETGLKEAKLMEGDDGTKYWKKGDKEGMVNADRKDFTVNQLKEALKNFKANKDDVQDEEVKAEALKKKFRSYEELKEDMRKMEADIKTDAEILTELVDKFKSVNATVATRVELLDDIEFLVHQVDNGVYFADLGGLVEMSKSLNDTSHEEIRSGAAFVLGAATQSNPKVQIKALEAGLLQQLIHMVNTEKSIKLRSRVIYAISSTIRHFPHAQYRFLQLGGVSSLLSLFSIPGAEALHIKVVSLMNDLLNEQRLTEKHLDENNSVEVEKFKQYKKVPLLDALLEHGWCRILPPLLEITVHDSREKVLNAMDLVASPCQKDFQQSVGWLRHLESEYEELSLTDEDGDDYFDSMANKARGIVKKVLEKQEL